MPVSHELSASLGTTQAERNKLGADLAAANAQAANLNNDIAALSALKTQLEAQVASLATDLDTSRSDLVKQPTLAMRRPPRSNC